MIDTLTYSLCRSMINESIQKLNNFSFKVVSKLPESGEKNYIYLVQKKTLDNTKDKYDEYIWLESAWEYLGNMDVALENYLKRDEYKQPDWNQDDPQASDYIKNKADLNKYLKKTEWVQSNWGQNDSSQPDYIKNKADLSVFLKKADYKPSDWNEIDDKAFAFIKNKPAILTGVGANSEAHNGNSANSATGNFSCTEGQNTTAKGEASHSEGQNTKANSKNQHVQGRYNIVDEKNKYVHIVGNGTSQSPSNAHTLDWNGNSWYQTSVLVGGNDMDKYQAGLYEDGVIFKSSDSGSVKQFKLTVSDQGILTVVDLATQNKVPILLDTPETIQKIADAVIAKTPKATEVNF